MRTLRFARTAVALAMTLLATSCGIPEKPAAQAEMYRNYRYSFSDDRDEVARLLAARQAKGPSDDELLERVSRAAFEYFWNEAHPETGFIYDSLSNRSSSSAATGFGLASLCVADHRGWITHEQAYERVRKTLRAMLADPGWENIEGLFFHWVDPATGRWTGMEGMCLHDHVALLCGVLTVREYFKGTEIETLAGRIVGMSNWEFLTHRGKGTSSDRAGVLSNVSSWDNEDWGGVVEYDGMKLDYLLAIGAASNAVDAWYWKNWAASYPWDDYRGRYRRIARAAIWIHQWDNCYLDLFCMRDAYADYFQNSVENTLANRQWCIDNDLYDAETWGLNPTTGPDPSGDPDKTVYGNYGAPPPPTNSWQQGHVQDGTIAFAAAVPSIIFTPGESLLVLRRMWDTLRETMWGKYGFTTSFNLTKDWYSRDYIGIDLGPVILNIENYRSGLIWKYFMRAPEVKRALRLTGFVGVVDSFDPMEHSLPYAEWSVSRGSAKLEVVRGGAFDGERCLSIRTQGAADGLTIEAAPLRRDFSYHSRLGLHARGTDKTAPFRVSLVDGRGATATLEPVAAMGDKHGDWTPFAWKLDSAEGVDLQDIRKVVFEPIADLASRGFRVDRICLHDEDRPF